MRTFHSNRNYNYFLSCIQAIFVKNHVQNEAQLVNQITGPSLSPVVTAFKKCYSIDIPNKVSVIL